MLRSGRLHISCSSFRSVASFTLDAVRVVPSWQNLFSCSVRLAMIAILAVAILTIAPLGSIAKTIDLAVQRDSLDNGLQILLLREPAVPAVSYYTCYKVGSRNERPGITGISHFVEHMMFNGAKRYGPKEFDEILESNGGTSNANTSNDVTFYFEDIPSDKLELSIDLDSDRMENLAFEPSSFEAELGVVREERRVGTDNDVAGKMEEELYAAAFRASPYQWPVIGWMGDLMRITRQDAIEYFKTYCVPNNATIVVVGDFDPTQTLQLIRKYYADIPPGPPIGEPVDSEEEQIGERRIKVEKEAQLPAVMVGYHVPSVESRDVFALDVLQTILTKGESSRLYRRLIDEEQMALSVSSSYGWSIDPGLFYFHVEMKPGRKPEEAEVVLYQELEKLSKEPVSQKELRRAKNMLKTGFLRWLKTDNDKANAIGVFEIVFGDWKKLGTIIESYENISAQDIQRVVEKHFGEKNRTVVTLVPLAY